MEDVSEFQIKSVLFLQGFSILQLLMMWNWGKSVGSLKINRERNGYLVTRELAYLASGPLVHIPFLCSKQWIILFSCITEWQASLL